MSVTSNFDLKRAVCPTCLTCRLASLALLFLLAPAPSHAAAFPLIASSDGRYLVDRDGVPFLINGDSSWYIAQQLGMTDMVAYLEDRRANGFNAVFLQAMDSTYADNAPSNANGDLPFTDTLPDGVHADFTTTNEAYWAFVDRVVETARMKGILVLYFPCFLGYSDDEGRTSDGWTATMNANGPDRCRSFGEFLGDRCQKFPNLVWVHGGDWTPPAGSPAESNALQILMGIKSRDTVYPRFHTAHWRRLTTSFDRVAFRPHLNLNAVYSGDVLNAVPGDAYQRSLMAFDQANLPHFLIECRYENLVGGGGTNGPLVTDRGVLRRQAYWTVLSGGNGHFLGNWPVWQFKPGWDGPNGIHSPGNQDMTRFQTLFESRRFHTLVPDRAQVTVIAGRGTFGTTDYVTAGRASDGTLVMAYVPPTGTSASTLMVDMTKLSGPAFGKWFNPAVGAFTTISGSPFTNAGSRTFTTPGDNGTATNDWVLILETTTLPTGWQHRDIGAVSVAGNATYSGATFTVSGSGTDITGGDDEFHYAYQAIRGDCDIRARVLGSGNIVNVWSKQGVMIRQSSDPDSTHASMYVTGGHELRFEMRPTKGGDTTTITNGQAGDTPYWVRMAREGNTFTGYTSVDGRTWTAVSSADIAMDASGYIGLAVCSHNDGVMTTTLFDNVSIFVLSSTTEQGVPRSNRNR